MCVFITAGPITKLCAGVERDSEGRVLEVPIELENNAAGGDVWSDVMC